MRVTEGTSYEQTDGTWQKPEVELDDSDFARLMVELGIDDDKAASVPTATRYAVLSAYARRLMLATQLTSTRRLDTDWVEKTGRPQLEALTAELQGLIKKIKDLS